VDPDVEAGWLRCSHDRSAWTTLSSDKRILIIEVMIIEIEQELRLR
jgi:hypothetical protein